MVKNIFLVKGISGSGKSSRVFQVLKFLEVNGFTFIDFIYDNIEGNEKNVGILVDELDIVFIGKFYKSGAIERWQGYDSVTSSFCKAEYFSEFLRKNSGSYSFFIEGAGITQTHRLRPKFLHQELGFESIFVQYYNYLNKEDYLRRIVYRSGEEPKKEAMWDKNKGFTKDHLWSLSDMAEIENTCDCFVSSGGIDEPIWGLGEKFFLFIGMESLIPEFKKFVTEYDYINKNRFENF